MSLEITPFLATLVNIMQQRLCSTDRKAFVLVGKPRSEAHGVARLACSLCGFEPRNFDRADLRRQLLSTLTDVFSKNKKVMIVLEHQLIRRKAEALDILI